MAQDTLAHTQASPDTIPVPVAKPLWELGISELTARNLETSGRREVNDMLQNGWTLLHIYTLRYPGRESPRSIWHERG